MNWAYRSTIPLAAWLVACMVSACARSAPTPTSLPPTRPPATPASTDTPKPAPFTPTPEVPVVDLTFDGQSCQYEGPEVVHEGKLVIVVNDLTDDPAFHMHVFKIDEGKTWQDMLDYIGEPGTYVPPVPWASSVGIGALVEDNPNARRFTLTPGMHGIVCALHNGGPEGIWPAAPFEVSASSSG